ncbi:MAG: hypothetical protein ACI9J0_004346 [Cryomorphaceae bacterium]|jgi:hypothetical protein
MKDFQLVFFWHYIEIKLTNAFILLFLIVINFIMNF